MPPKKTIPAQKTTLFSMWKKNDKSVNETAREMEMEGINEDHLNCLRFLGICVNFGKSS